jgi:hypothetical protein
VLANETLLWAMFADEHRRDIRDVAGRWLDVVARVTARPAAFDEGIWKTGRRSGAKPPRR